MSNVRQHFNRRALMSAFFILLLEVGGVILTMVVEYLVILSVRFFPGVSYLILLMSIGMAGFVAILLASSGYMRRR